MISRITVVTPTETRAFEPSKEGHSLEYIINSGLLSIEELNVDGNIVLQHVFKEWHTLAVIHNEP